MSIDHASAAGQHAAGARRLDPLGARAGDHCVVSVDNPTLFFVSALRLSLIADGIDVRGPAVDIDDVLSAALGDAVAQPTTIAAAVGAAVRLMKTSQNLTPKRC